MLDPTSFSLFLVASWALIIAPGPDMIYVITQGMSQGRKAGLFSALGVTLGILVHTLSATLGLAVVLQTSALAFLIVKYAGALYLIYLGLKTCKEKRSFIPFEVEERQNAKQTAPRLRLTSQAVKRPKSSGSKATILAESNQKLSRLAHFPHFRTIFWQGVLSNVFNPKVALFFLTFLPQFVNPSLGHPTWQMLTLGLLFAFFGLLFLSVLGYFSGGIGQWLLGQVRFTEALRWLTGSILIGLGIRLALTKRK